MLYESRVVLVVGAADVVSILLVVGIVLVVALVLVVGVVDVDSVVVVKVVVDVLVVAITATKVCHAIARDRGCWHGAFPGASQHTHLDWM